MPLLEKEVPKKGVFDCKTTLTLSRRKCTHVLYVPSAKNFTK